MLFISDSKLSETLLERNACLSGTREDKIATLVRDHKDLKKKLNEKGTWSFGPKIVLLQRLYGEAPPQQDQADQTNTYTHEKLLNMYTVEDLKDDLSFFKNDIKGNKQELFCRICSLYSNKESSDLIKKKTRICEIRVHLFNIGVPTLNSAKKEELFLILCGCFLESSGHYADISLTSRLQRLANYLKPEIIPLPVVLHQGNANISTILSIFNVSELKVLGCKFGIPQVGTKERLINLISEKCSLLSQDTLSVVSSKDSLYLLLCLDDIGLAKVCLKMKLEMEGSTRMQLCFEILGSIETLSKGPKGKAQITRQLKTEMWMCSVGDKLECACFCCGKAKISAISFSAGHITAEAKGGQTNLTNLIPICTACNLSMGVENLKDYSNRVFPSNRGRLEIAIAKLSLL